MSKILFTLAWYHDGGTLKPQLVLSCTPVTNLVVKGSDWKGARFGNTNATDGARHRFEYSFTGGKSVTRASLVMNTTAILPPLVWLSRHPTGPPTKHGARGKPLKNPKEEARRIATEELKKIEAKKRPIERRHTSPSTHRSSPHRDKNDDYGSEDEYDRRQRRKRTDNRTSSDYYPRDERSRSSRHSRSPESRRRDRHRRHDSASSGASAEQVREDNRRRRSQRRHDAQALDPGEYAGGAGGDGGGGGGGGD